MSKGLSPRIAARRSWFCIGSVLLWLSGSPSLAQNHFLDLDGSDDTVMIPSDAGVNPGVNGDLTVEAWFRTGTNALMDIAMTSNTPAGAQWGLRILPTGEAAVVVRDTGTGGGLTQDAASTGALTDNGWYHLAGVVDRVNSRLKLYVNGVLETDDALTMLGNIGTNAPLYVGSFKGAVAFFQGQIDEVRVWNDVRTPTEIMDNMDMELTGSEANLVAYYDFNQGICGGSNPGVTTLPALVAGGLDGALQSFALTGCSSNWVCGGATCGFPDNSVPVELQSFSVD